MAFLNPFLLFGIGSIAAPIIIHLLMNRKIKPVVWAAMRFLEKAIKKNKKRMDMEDMILLALRCLLLILLALALARPVFNGAAGAAVGRGSEVAVIVLDNSYSMGQNDGGASRFDLAKQAGEQVIDSLPLGSSVAVLQFSDIVRASVPEPTFDLNLARKVVRDATLSDRSTNVQLALKQAIDTLTRHSGPSERIYLITDGQANGWSPVEDAVKLIGNATVKVTTVLVGSPELHNLCVSDVEIGSSMATVGEAVEFDVEVTNYGATEAKDVAVRVSVDAETPSDEGIISSIPPGASKRLALFTKFRAAGYHTVTGQINSDHLPEDDQRTIAVRALDDVRVLLVTDDIEVPSVDKATFYLANALTPVPKSERDSYFIKTKTISPVEMEGVKLSDYEAVVLANVASVPAGSVDALATYINRGGGLVIFPGPKTRSAFYNDSFGKKYNFLPAVMGVTRGNPDDQKTIFHLQGKGYDNKIVSIWRDPAAGTLSSANFYCTMALTPLQGHSEKAGEPQVIIKYNDGSPAIMERTWGRGRVILFSSSANTAWNDLPLHPVYLPLIDRTLGSLIERRDATLNIPVGSTFEMVCDQDWVGRDVIIKHVGDKESGLLRRVTLVNGTPMLQFEATDAQGAYEATVKTDPPALIKFATQSDPTESNLVDLSEPQLDTISKVSHIVRWAPNVRLDEQISKERGGTEIWTILAILVILAACVEMGLGGIFSAAK